MVLAGLARSPAEHLLRPRGSPRRWPGARLTAPTRVSRRRAPSSTRTATAGRSARPRADRALLERLGIAPTILDAGCCGLAGSFGYRAEHEPVSRTDRRGAVAAQGRAALGETGEPLVVDGFSCEMQLDQLSDIDSVALISIVRRMLEERAGAPLADRAAVGDAAVDGVRGDVVPVELDPEPGPLRQV